MAKPVPDGFHTLTPHLICKDASKAIEFYKKAFSAETHFIMPGKDGQGVGHAELKIGTSIFMMADECPEMGYKGPKSIGGTPVSLCLYVTDCDQVFHQAVAAGAKVLLPLTDQFYGDRSGTIEDPAGHVWTIGTHKEDLTPQQIGERMKKQFGGGCCSDH